MENFFGFLFVATFTGILIRFAVTAVMGLLTASTAEGAPPFAGITALLTGVGSIAAVGSLIIAVAEFFN